MAQFDKKQQQLANHPNLKARVLPNNIEAEQSVLGCVLIDEYAPIHILNDLKVEDFYSDSHREIYQAMLNIAARDVPIDIVTLVQETETMGVMEKAGGLTYLTTLSNIVPSAANFRHYCDIVKKNSLLRKLISASTRIIDNAFTMDGDNDALALAEREIYSLAEENDKSTLREIQPSVSEAIDKLEKIFADGGKAIRGVPTGFKGLNAMLNGLQPSDLILIAARPGQGKTSIGMNMIEHAALSSERRTEAGKPDPYKCAVFSLEMPAVQLAKRMVCSVAKVNMTSANSGKLSSEEWKRIYDAKTRLDKAHIYIDDSSLTTPIEILSKCRRLKREKGLDLVMVDYLQLMSSGKRVESRQQEISEITRTMKIAAKELNVPILLLSQLSREVEKRQVKIPQMSDLRESGAIEQDADIIMFIYREFDPNDETVEESKRNKAEIVIAKHRNGECGKVELLWDGKTVSFRDIDKSRATASLAENAPTDNGGSFMISDDAPVFGDMPVERKKPFTPSEASAEELLKVDTSDDLF